MVKTFGLTHISLTVRDIDMAYDFYHHVFGIIEYYRDENSIHASTPGSHDVITFVKGEKPEAEGTNHFGFRLTDPADITAAIEEVSNSGGIIIDHGEFAPGYPYLYANDPDGYVFEVWYE